MPSESKSRRPFIAEGLGLALTGSALSRAEPMSSERKALVSITLDLEMSRQYPTRDQFHWDYEKGNLDDPTKAYALQAARIAKKKGGRIHFFCVGRVLEQENVDWLLELKREGHPIGNHTYDHVNVRASTLDQVQFRFARAPWLARGMAVPDLIADNIALTTLAMKQRLDLAPAGFRTPGGFNDGLRGHEDVQKMLLSQGFKWVSSLYPAHPYGKVGEAPTEDVFAGIVKAQADAQPFVYPTGLIELPMNPISDVGAFRSTRWPLASFLKAVRLGVEWAIEHRAIYDFLAHPSCLVVEDPEFKVVELICDIVNANRDRVEIVGLDSVAARVKPGK